MKAGTKERTESILYCTFVILIILSPAIIFSLSLMLFLHPNNFDFSNLLSVKGNLNEKPNGVRFPLNMRPGDFDGDDEHQVAFYVPSVCRELFKSMWNISSQRLKSWKHKVEGTNVLK